jgi:hypothetical protein
MIMPEYVLDIALRRKCDRIFASDQSLASMKGYSLVITPCEQNDLEFRCASVKQEST